MSRIAVYRADGAEVVRLSPWQRVRLGLLAFGGAVLLAGFAVAAILVGLALAIPLALLAAAFLARLAWRLRAARRRLERGVP